MSPSRNRRTADKDRYIAKQELEVDELKTRCAVHLQKIKELQIELNKMVVKVSNKKDLQSKFCWNADDSTYVAAISKFCKEWLFPRYKFFHKMIGWSIPLRGRVYALWCLNTVLFQRGGTGRIDG